jgi:hypothetical protein
MRRCPMPRTMPYSVEDKVFELRKLADTMAQQDNPYAIEIHALAVDLIEGLNLDKKGRV